MCEVPKERPWRAGPVTTAMRELLTRMAATDAPAITDWGHRAYPTRLDGQTVNGATLNGLVIRGLAAGRRHERMVTHYRLTNAGRAYAERTTE